MSVRIEREQVNAVAVAISVGVERERVRARLAGLGARHGVGSAEVFKRIADL